MKDPKEEQWYFINITDIGPSSVSYFDVHDFDIYSIFVCVLYDSEINTNKQTRADQGFSFRGSKRLCVRTVCILRAPTPQSLTARGPWPAL